MTSISIIGTGKMGSAIADLSARADADIQIIRRRAGSSSSPERPDAEYGVVGDELTGELVVLAVPYESVADVLGITRIGSAERLSSTSATRLTSPRSMNWSSHQTLLLQLKSPRTSRMRQSSRRSTSTSAKHWPAAPMAERARRLCLPGTMQTRKSQSSAWSRQQASGLLTPGLFRVHGSLRRWAFCRSHWQQSQRPAGIPGSRYCREP